MFRYVLTYIILKNRKTEFDSKRLEINYLNKPAKIFSTHSNQSQQIAPMSIISCTYSRKLIQKWDLRGKWANTFKCGIKNTTIPKIIISDNLSQQIYCFAVQLLYPKLKLVTCFGTQSPMNLVTNETSEFKTNGTYITDTKVDLKQPQECLLI